MYGKYFIDWAIYVALKWNIWAIFPKPKEKYAFLQQKLFMYSQWESLRPPHLQQILDLF